MSDELWIAGSAQGTEAVALDVHLNASKVMCSLSIFSVCLRKPGTLPVTL